MTSRKVQFKKTTIRLHTHTHTHNFYASAMASTERTLFVPLIVLLMLLMLAMFYVGLATSAHSPTLTLDSSIQLDLAIYMHYYTVRAECGSTNPDSVATTRFCACVDACPFDVENPFDDSALQCAHGCTCRNPTVQMEPRPVYPNFSTLRLTNNQLFAKLATEYC